MNTEVHFELLAAEVKVQKASDSIIVFPFLSETLTPFFLSSNMKHEFNHQPSLISTLQYIIMQLTTEAKPSRLQTLYNIRCIK